MSTMTSVRHIAAPTERVFSTVADIANFSKAVPHIVRVDFLSEQRVGVGTRFRETRLMNGREASTELEVTEYIEGERIRLVSDSQGTVWDSVFTVVPRAEGCELTLVMDARPYKLLAKLTTPLLKGFIAKALEKDMDAVKAWCEARRA